jgi:hypothetical protein
VSILGTGMALVHLHHPSLASLPHQYKIHSVMERTPRGRAQETCGEGTKVVRTIEEVVDDPEVDLVRGSRCWRLKPHSSRSEPSAQGLTGTVVLIVVLVDGSSKLMVVGRSWSLPQTTRTTSTPNPPF